MKPALCPVCDGSGKYKDKECHGCGSKGWIEVHEDVATPLPYRIVPYPHPYDDPYPWYPTIPREPWYTEPYTLVIW